MRKSRLQSEAEIVTIKESMINYVLILFILLWLLDFIQIPFLYATLFTIVGNPFTLYDLLIVTLFLFMIKILRGNFRIIAVVLFIMWILSILGIMVFDGFSNFVIFAVIIAIVLYIIR